MEIEMKELLKSADSVLKGMNKIYAIDPKHSDKKVWMDAEEYERIFMHRLNNKLIGERYE